MKNNFIKLVILMVCMCCIFSLMACSKHIHYYTEEVSNIPATCTETGKIIRKCSCGEENVTIIEALGHNYKVVSNKVATCTEDGEKITSCTRCNKIIKEKSKKGHNFDYNGLCSRCRRAVIYDIELLFDLPMELGNKSAKFVMTDWSFYIQDIYLCCLIDGNKTYDSDGEYATNDIRFKFILKEKDTGTIVYSRDIYIVDMIVGQVAKEQLHVIAYWTRLDKSKKYTLEIIL